MINVNVIGECSNAKQALIEFLEQLEKEKATKNSGNEKSLAKWFFNQSITGEKGKWKWKLQMDVANTYI